MSANAQTAVAPVHVSESVLDQRLDACSTLHKKAIDQQIKGNHSLWRAVAAAYAWWRAMEIDNQFLKRKFEMTNLTDEQIEDAFARIRAEFEKRNNEAGLEILDSFEEQRNAREGLSDRQIAWLEKQLDGTWRAVGSKSMPDATVRADPVPKDEAALLDAMIESRLTAQGKTLVDADRIDRLGRRVPRRPD